MEKCVFYVPGRAESKYGQSEVGYVTPQVRVDLLSNKSCQKEDPAHTSGDWSWAGRGIAGAWLPVLEREPRDKIA